MYNRWPIKICQTMQTLVTKACWLLRQVAVQDWMECAAFGCVQCQLALESSVTLSLAPWTVTQMKVTKQGLKAGHSLQEFQDECDHGSTRPHRKKEKKWRNHLPFPTLQLLLRWKKNILLFDGLLAISYLVVRLETYGYKFLKTISNYVLTLTWDTQVLELLMAC